MKTNKTKPIKKLMIFTIITVMIVSLFAVPTFALVQPDWASVSGSLEPETFTDIWGAEQSTAGMYAIRLTHNELRGALSSVTGGQNKPLTFGVFGDADSFSYLNCYACVETVTAVKTWYNLNVSDGPDEYVAEFVTTYSAGDMLGYSIKFPNASFSYDTVGGSDEIMYVTFYITAYPPEALTAPANEFWDLVTYSVYSVSSTNPPIDPEEPDDPTPPADGEEQGIFAVWSKITQWIIQGLASVSNAFYADGKLTLLGTLCIIPIALGLAFLLIGIIQKFLRLRG